MEVDALSQGLYFSAAQAAASEAAKRSKQKEEAEKAARTKKKCIFFGNRAHPGRIPPKAGRPSSADCRNVNGRSRCFPKRCGRPCGRKTKGMPIARKLC